MVKQKLLTISHLLKKMDLFTAVTVSWCLQMFVYIQTESPQSVSSSSSSSSCQSGGQLDAVDPQHHLRLDDHPLVLVPVSLPEPHVDFGPGLGLLDHGGLDPDQLLPQQRPSDQGEVLRADQQHLLHPDPLPALRLDVVLDQDQVLAGDLPLAASKVHDGEQPAEVLLADPLVHGADHRGVSAPLLLLRDRDQLRPRRPGQGRPRHQVPAHRALCSDSSGEQERLSS